MCAAHSPERRIGKHTLKIVHSGIRRRQSIVLRNIHIGKSSKTGYTETTSNIMTAGKMHKTCRNVSLFFARFSRSAKLRFFLFLSLSYYFYSYDSPFLACEKSHFSHCPPFLCCLHPYTPVFPWRYPSMATGPYGCRHPFLSMLHTRTAFYSVL